MVRVASRPTVHPRTDPPVRSKVLDPKLQPRKLESKGELRKSEPKTQLMPTMEPRRPVGGGTSAAARQQGFTADYKRFQLQSVPVGDASKQPVSKTTPAPTTALTTTTPTNAPTTTTPTTPTAPVRETDPAVAAQSSRAALNEPIEPIPAVDGDREILADPRDATLGTPTGPNVAAQIEKNTDVVKAQRDQLSPADQKKYDDLDARFQNDPDTRLSMQTMLLEKRLDSKTLDELDQLSKSPKVEGLEPNKDDQVLRETVREIATPERINQGGRGTCAPTVALIKLAQDDPAEYVRLTRGLASPEGTVTTKNGTLLTREPNMEKPDDSGRTSTQRLLGPALMEASNAGVFDYDDGADGHRLLGINTGNGLSAGGAENADEILFGRDFQQLATHRTDGPIAPYDDGFPVSTERKSVDAIREQLAQGKTVTAGLMWGGADENGRVHGRHKLLVTGIKTDNGQEYVEYINPWGTKERMKVEAFEKRLNNAQA